ncbi:hypothetical protein [Winogradskyella luteola]|uniref:Uncharacterized protein n=1 Tax=Winogradskyella luteola TaxID=2828330 RepID=A0A9X1F6P5_9FLAO|nr:hypothetical protein [Winogradskyella luteola]MBV7268397.1 hypothetical protein [Winogradskyella luteola]
MALETTYTVVSKSGGQLFFKFDLNGYLIEFKYSGRELTKKAAKYVHSVIIKLEKDMDFFNNKKGFEITKGEPDLSFGVFWNEYDDKMKKKVCQDLWKKLKDDDRYNAIAFIPKLKSRYRVKNLSTPLPDTYLRQKRWLD